MSSKNSRLVTLRRTLLYGRHLILHRRTMRTSRSRQIVTFTAAEQEVVDEASEPPYRSYARIAAALTFRHPDDPVTESAVKKRMSRARGRYYACKGYANLWERYTRRRRQLRRGQAPKEGPSVV